MTLHTTLHYESSENYYVTLHMTLHGKNALRYGVSHPILPKKVQKDKIKANIEKLVCNLKRYVRWMMKQKMK